MSEAIEIANGRVLEHAFVAPAPHEGPAAELQSSIDRSQRALLALQHPEGYWQAALEAKSKDLIALARKHGGPDNITAVLLRAA